MMPGLSGYDVCRRIRADAATALLPVVLVTALDPDKERVKGIEAGADDFLTKPINQGELFARVRSLLRVKALQDEVKRQADALQVLNATLEQRVNEQVAQIDRLGQLQRFFSPNVADAIMTSGEKSILAPHRREICYAFLDLRGFTTFTDVAEPEEVEGMLREFHQAMGSLVTQAEGTIDRFAGDGILIFFNDPIAMPDLGMRAARMALDMQARFVPLRERWLNLRLRSRARHRHCPGLRHARRLRLRRPLGLFGHRQRRQSGGAAVRRGARRADPDRPARPCRAGRQGHRGRDRSAVAEGLRATGAIVRADRPAELSRASFSALVCRSLSWSAPRRHGRH